MALQEAGKLEPGQDQQRPHAILVEIVATTDVYVDRTRVAG